MPFGSKFGCPKENLPGIFVLAKALKLNIIGVSFHVGSRCTDPTAYSDAIKLSREVFDIAKEYDYNMRLLDIGGGFPGRNDMKCDETFISIAENIKRQLIESFSDIQSIEIIAEPGRFFATSCGTLVSNITNRKILLRKNSDKIDKIIHYYINSSLYGLYNNIIFDKAIPKIELLNTAEDQEKYKSVIFGQTCDSMDKIADGIELPELVCGNWIITRDHGAYTNASASSFNGFGQFDTVYIFTH
jgi:diaminopimelate decarboxylase